MPPFRAVVVDDEGPARDELKYLLAQDPRCQVIGEAESGWEALSVVNRVHPDVVFLDMQMRDMNGYDVARELLQQPEPPLVVFATAYDEYALKAFELGAVDYLLKPFDKDRLALTVERLEKTLGQPAQWQAAIDRMALLLQNRTGPNKLPLEKAGKIVLIDYQEIIFAQAKEGHVQVSTANESLRFNGSLTDLEERLSPWKNFLRIHKSFLVNLNKVQEVIPWFKGTYWLVMADRNHTQLPVSKLQIKALKDLLGIG